MNTARGVADLNTGKQLRFFDADDQYVVGVVAPRVVAEGAAHVAHNSGNDEWFTPPVIIEAARRCMGGIDMDPASNRIANEVVRATTYFSKNDDGLCREWSGRLWLNPPYSKQLLTPFIKKLLASPTVTQAIVLVNNAGETEWGQLLLGAADAVCHLRGRVRFWSPARDSHSPLQGQLAVYFGRDVGAFEQEFGGLGCVFTVNSRKR